MQNFKKFHRKKKNEKFSFENLVHCFWVRLYYECNVVRPSSFFTYIMLEYSRCLKYYLVKIDNRIVFENLLRLFSIRSK